ncbi:MAG: hypothetical protein LBJ08_00650, partial [Bifidobacteriaceae bacterium]|nr:hypothetical protein [Bifidobacteriaceae bacterium]
PETVHGRQSQELAGAATFPEVAKQIAAMMAGRVFTAHNAALDRRFLVAEFARAGWQVPLTSRITLCTMAAAREMWPGSPRRLGPLCRQRGIEPADTRTPSANAFAVVRLVQDLLESALTASRNRRIGRLPWAAQLEAASLVRWPSQAVESVVAKGAPALQLAAHGVGERG